MNPPELWLLSLQAFAAVIAVLGLLAAAVQALTMVFRGPAPMPAANAAASPSARPRSRGPQPAADDPFVQAAIHAAARQLVPGAQITHVTEVEEDARR